MSEDSERRDLLRRAGAGDSLAALQLARLLLDLHASDDAEILALRDRAAGGDEAALDRLVDWARARPGPPPSVAGYDRRRYEIVTRPEDWAEDGPPEAPRARLTTTFSLNGSLMHLVAYRVFYHEDMQNADPVVADGYEQFSAAADQGSPFFVLTIRGVEYAVFGFPGVGRRGRVQAPAGRRIEVRWDPEMAIGPGPDEGGRPDPTGRILFALTVHVHERGYGQHSSCDCHVTGYALAGRSAEHGFQAPAPHAWSGDYGNWVRAVRSAAEDSPASAYGDCSNGPFIETRIGARPYALFVQPYED